MLATVMPTSLRGASRAREKCTTSRKKIRRKTLTFAQGMKTQARGARRVDPARRRDTQGTIARRFEGRIAQVEDSKVGDRCTNNGRETKMVQGTNIVRSTAHARIQPRSATSSFV